MPEDNQFKGGSHFHFVNHLWPNLKLEHVKKMLETLEFNLPHEVHIKFDDRTEAEIRSEKTDA